jgi:GAF domain-containing protein
MCRVLIIDDEEFSAETIKMVLEEAGEARADYATTYKDARELVQQSLKPNEPYEVFLIDLRLGPGKDGIEFMRELRAASPDTDAIIFTGLEDSAHGVRAYEAGAFRYLYKPFENEELLYLLKALKQWRKEQREHDWQKLFTSMMEETLRKSSFSEAADIIVQYALKLGFSRAHLFWIPTQEDANPDNLMIGIACAGKGCIPHFSGSNAGLKLYPLKQWFDLNRAKQAHEVVYFEPGEAEDVQQQAEGIGYRWPRGEIVFLPLWGSNRLLGELMLDHGQREKALSKHEYSLLNLFARQIAIVLENASLISREKWTVQETVTISQIGRHVTGRAAEETNLSELLDEVHEQISFLIEASNFSVILVEPETGRLEIGLWYEKGIRQDPARLPGSMEIESFLLNQEHGIFWQQEVAKYLQKNNLSIERGEIPTSCIGVQMRVGKKIIGGIVAKSYVEGFRFAKHDHVLLSAVASQISGAIQLTHVNEAEKRDSERLNVLRQVMTEMLRIGQEKEDDLWLTTLTIATANFGMGFNRALLFLENDEHTLLVGKNGVGTNDSEMARKDWEYAVETNYQLDDFLTNLQDGTLQLTPFHDLAAQINLPLNRDNNAFMQVLKGRHLILVEEDQINNKLPSQVRKKITPSQCAILPILTGNRAIGLVLVDNKHNGLPLNEKMLNHLQTLLNYTGLVWETLRQQSRTESLLDVNHQIMGEARLQSLKDTLRTICKTAQKFTRADWVLIYPLKEGKKYEFDRVNATYIGNLELLDDVIKVKPNSKGISAYILRNRILVVPDVDNSDLVIGDIQISKHAFIKRERVKAILGIAIYDAQRDEPLGILYLDYRTPQDFSELDEHHAKSFASLAGVAISNERRYDEQRHRKRLESAQETAEAIGTGLDLPQMFRKALNRLHRFFKQTTLCILTYDEEENALKFAPSTLEFYKIQNPKFEGQQTFPLGGKSLACRIARKALKAKRPVSLNVADVREEKDYLPLNPHTLSELCVSLMSSEQDLLGVLVLERPNLHGFDEDDIALVETVARQLSMAIERAQHSEQLAFKSTVAANYAWAAEIAHDINREIGHIRNWAFLIKDISDENSIYSKYADKIEESAAILSSGPWISPPKQNLLFDQVIAKSLENIRIRKDITLEVDLRCTGSYIYVNTLTFHRILKHLIRNASDGMNKITWEKKIIIGTRQLENEWVELQIEDSGLGVSEEARPYIFQRQYSTKDSGGGVGLLIVRQMVEDMDGKIRLLPQEPGKGAVFSIKLPSSMRFISEDEGKEAE